MRILHIIPTYLPAMRYGGITRSVHSLCSSLVKRGHKVHVYTTNVDGSKNSNVPLGKAVDLQGVTVHYFNCSLFRNFYHSPSMKEELLKTVREFDLLHIHSIYRWPTWAAARIAEHAKIPYVLSPRGMLVKELVRRKSKWVKLIWLQFIEKRTIENAAGIHVTSELEAQEIGRFGFRLPKVSIVPNGCEIEVQNSEPNGMQPEIEEVIKRKPELLFLGRINWKKGLDRLILSLTHVPNVYLVIAGNDEDDYQPVLEKLAKRHGVLDRIRFVGPVYGPAKIKLMESATLFVLPSYSENFGNAVLEAMSAGCPVVVTPEVGLAATIKASGAGVVVEGDPIKLGQSIKELLSNKQRLQQMGEAGKKIVHQRFAYSLIAKEMEEVYMALIHI